MGWGGDPYDLLYYHSVNTNAPLNTVGERGALFVIEAWRLLNFKGTRITYEANTLLIAELNFQFATKYIQIT